jgi:hypothetical protein
MIVIIIMIVRTEDWTTGNIRNGACAAGVVVVVVVMRSLSNILVLFDMER